MTAGLEFIEEGSNRPQAEINQVAEGFFHLARAGLRAEIADVVSGFLRHIFTVFAGDLLRFLDATRGDEPG